MASPRSRLDTSAIYKRLTHYIQSMSASGGQVPANNFNTKLEFAIHAEFRSVLHKYNELEGDYMRCIEMLKELKLHNIATHTNLSHRIAQSDNDHEIAQREIKQQQEVIENYEVEAQKQSRSLQQQQEQIQELKRQNAEYKLAMEESEQKWRQAQAQHVDTHDQLKRRLNREIDELRDELSTIKNENSRLQKLIDNDDVNVVMERSLRRRVQKSEDALSASRKENKELNAQWEQILATRVKEIHDDSDQKIGRYQDVIKKLQRELQVLRGMFK